jgi:uncharacterized protein YbjT (DUF2867 family)
MPVLLTRPASAVARATASLLLDDGAQVRLFGPDAPAELRARGAFVASGDHDDHGLLEAALAQVHTLIHTGPGLLVDDPDRLVIEGVLVLDAAVRAGVERIVLLSLPGASPKADDALRAAAGRLEAYAASLDVPTVVVRSSVVDTVALRDAVAFLHRTPDEVVIAPVRVEDVAAALLAIDQARSNVSAGHVVFTASGAEPLTLDGWLRRTGVRHDDGTDVVGRVYSPGGGRTVLTDALAGPWTDDVGDTVADLWAFAKVTPGLVG